MKKSLLLAIISLLLIFLVGCEAIQLTQDPNKSDYNETITIIDKEKNKSEKQNNFEGNPELEIPVSNQNNENGGTEFNPQGGETISPEFPNPMTIETDPLFINCASSTNGDIEQEVYISLMEIDDPIMYETRKREALNLINQCYTVRISEEYEVEPGNISTAGGTFKYKIIDSDDIFTVIPFYPIVDIYDYSGFIGTQLVTYISSSTANDIFNYYQNVEPIGYKYMDFIQDQKLVFTNEIENKTITINLTSQGAYTLISFDLLQQFDVE